MRRRYAGRSDALVRPSEGEQGFWPSYADMMSAVALILFFLMLLSYIQNLITGNDLQNTQELLAETQTELSDTQELLSLTLKEVEQAENELEKITIDLDEARLTLTQQQAQLTEQQEQLAEQQEELAAQDKLLADQKALIGEQEEYMKAASEELLAMRSQMQTIAVLRLSILQQIRDSLVKVMGDASKVSIGENGNIVLSEDILFDVGSAEIKPEAMPALDQLATVFVKFLSDSENTKYVESIVISGHTDSTGTDERNRELSTQRANSVLDYLLSSGGSRIKRYASCFCSAGYGKTRPVADNATEEGRAANRRIEISIILKDESVMTLVESYLNIDVPDAVTNGGAG